jgi:phosphatidate cytidylyltransferase
MNDQPVTQSGKDDGMVAGHPKRRSVLARAPVCIGLVSAVVVLFTLEAILDTGLLVLGAVMLLAFLALREFYAMSRLGGFRPFSALGLTMGMIVIIVTYMTSHREIGFLPEPASSALLDFTTVLLLCLVLLALKRRSFSRASLTDATLTVFGVLYIPLLLSFLIRIRLVPADGLWLLILLVFITEGGDIPAFLVGSKLGRKKIAPHVSPAKTVEGTLAQVAFGLVATVVFTQLNVVTAVPSLAVYCYGFTVTALSLPSDLAESVIKRCLGVKDSGTGLKSYGGILDRIDCLLFAAPVAYLVLMLVRIYG